MSETEKRDITEFTRCDFTLIQAHYQALSEAKKNASKEDKEACAPQMPDRDFAGAQEER